MAGGSWVVLPTKAFSRAKTRLADVLPAEGRARLAREFFRRTLQLACEQPFSTILVACEEPDPVFDVDDPRIELLLDEDSGGLRVVVDRALTRAWREQADSVLILMPALPFRTSGDLVALAALLDGSDVVLAPDEDDEGTNALLVKNRLLRDGRFGQHGSFEAHLNLVGQLSLNVAICRTPGLAFDVDTPNDYAEYVARTTSGGAAGAGYSS